MHRIQDKTLIQKSAFIGGKWISSSEQSKSYFDVINPYSGEVITSVLDSSVSMVQQAADEAEAAFNEWKGTLAQDRASILEKWHDLMMDNQEDLAAIMTAEQGKPLEESKGEIAYAAGFLKWFSQEAQRTYGDIIPSHTSSGRILTFKQPVGVCAAITPWNFPAAMITRKAGAALAAGCTMVVKPAKETPLSALALGVLAQRAGLPDGVFNILPGTQAQSIGEVLSQSEKIHKLSFTGSTKIGRQLMQQSASTLKRLSLELGGNAPFIVFEDADLDAAVDGAIACKFRNAGQTCVCANRFYVQENIYEDFISRLSRKVSKLKIGDGFSKDTDIGPLINSQAVDKVLDHISDALDKGARVICGGKKDKSHDLLFQPTVLADMDADMKVSCEETFGPVAPIYKFQSEQNVIEMANDTIYGLASYFYTNDNARAWRVSEALEYGMVALNTGLLSTPVAPFGGVKQSGFGREGSKYGIDEYMNIKYVLMDLG